MNLEKINLTPKQPLESAPKESEKLSSLDKLRAIKGEIEIDRQQTLIEQKAQEKENKLLKEQLYQEEKASLDIMITRRDEITQELAEIKLKRGEIMVKGKEVITEAKQDKEVEKTLRTKEVFIDVFSEEKAEWKQLQDKVSTLNIELKNLNLLIPSKETEVQKLFEQTEAGQEENERKRQEHIQSIKDRIDPLLKRTISNRGVSQDNYRGYYNIFQLNDYNPRFISSLRERLEIMKPALTDLTDYIILEPAEGAFKEDYFEVLTEFLYDKFMDNHDGYGFNEQTIDKIKESKFDVDIKQEIRSSLELYNFKAKNEGKLEKAVNTSKFNEHFIKNEELISKSKDCLEDSLEVVVSKAKTYFSEIKNLLADKGMLPDEDVVEKYRNLLPKNIQELNFKIGGNHSTQMYIEFPIKKDVQKLTLYAQGVLEKNIEKNERLLQEKRGKLFSSGMKKLENEITRLHDELKSLHSKNRDLYFELDKEITAFRELKIEVNGSEEMLLYSINKLINSFHDKFNYNFDSDVIFGKNSYPRIDQILTIDKIYDKLNYIPLSQESNQLMEQEKEMKAKLQRDSEAVDSKLAEVFNK